MCFKEAGEFFALVIEKVTNPVRWNKFAREI